MKLSEVSVWSFPYSMGLRIRVKSRKLEWRPNGRGASITGGKKCWLRAIVKPQEALKWPKAWVTQRSRPLRRDPTLCQKHLPLANKTYWNLEQPFKTIINTFIDTFDREIGPKWMSERHSIYLPNPLIKLRPLPPDSQIEGRQDTYIIIFLFE